MDIISIGATEFRVHKPVARLIRRLQFEGENSDSIFYPFLIKDLKIFEHLIEVRVICKDGMNAWWGALEDHEWPCGVDNVWMIDPSNGTMMKGTELDAICLREARESYLEQGYDYDTGLPLTESAE